MPSPTTDPAPARGRPRGPLPTVGGPFFALAALFSMNLLNYVDRYSFFAAGTHVQKDLGISDERYGVLSASFMIVYTIVSPLMGLLGDRYDRRLLLAAGVGLWSLATVGTALSTGFADMFVWRALLGVGEASYGVIAPALLADLFSPARRGRVMGVYYLALPLGGALGYGIGGWVADAWNWRAAFLVVGLPGLFAAFAGLLLNDPGRGASERPGAEAAPRPARPTAADSLQLFRTPTFLYNTFGMAAVTFATGAYAVWGSTFYQRVHGMTGKQAGLWIGGMTAVAGLVGIAIGIVLPDVLSRFTRRAYLVLAGSAVGLAVPFGLAGLVEDDRVTSMAMLFVAMVLMATVLGPCNAVTADVVPANRRAAGYAVSIFLIHLFGDISSPILIGWVAGRAGRPSVADSALGRLLASFGAGPVGGTNLTAGMLCVVPVLLLGCALFWLGSRHLPADRERARLAGLGAEPSPYPAH